MPTDYGQRLSADELNDLVQVFDERRRCLPATFPNNRGSYSMKFSRTILLHFIAVMCSLFTASAQDARVFELQALSPKFWELVDHGAKLEKVATGFGFTEGPMWDAAGFLYVSDETINKQRFFAFTPTAGER